MDERAGGRCCRERRGDGARRGLLEPAVLAALGLQGCATEDESVMPWASPQPGEGGVILPGSLMRQ